MSDNFSSKTVQNQPSLNSASLSVTNISTQNLVGTNLTLSSVAVSGDITSGGNYKNSKWTISQNDISGNGNLYAKSLYLTNDISNNGSISTNGNLYVKGQNVGSQLSQWVTSGASVYYSGNVSVNKITNAYTLDVSGNVNVSGGIIVGGGASKQIDSGITTSAVGNLAYIPFNFTFKTIPAVIVSSTGNYNGSAVLSTNPYNITTSGFNLAFDYNNGANIGVNGSSVMNWIAIG